MRVSRGAALGLLLACFAGCQNGYPIPATQCDEWCDATKMFGCFDYDPAGCVASCNHHGGDATQCHAQLDAVLSCVRSQPSAVTCEQFIGDLANGGPPGTCASEQDDFEACAIPYADSIGAQCSSFLCSGS